MSNKVAFIDTDPDVVLSEFKADYEQLSGKKLQPGQAETLLIQAGANRLALMLNQMNEAANQNLLAFATGAGLEALGELLGVYRLPPASAECLLEFSLVSGHGPLVIPQGIRVQSIDGQLVFITIESNNVSAPTSTIQIKAVCTIEGDSGNNYAAGEIAVILDPQPYISSVSNIDTTAGGSDEENDEELRERLYLAPSRFSVAGPSDAYKFFAKSAHPLIIDVAIKDHFPNPGDVSIYPLLLNGVSPTTEVIDAVNAACNSKRVRPLTDTVYVTAPTLITYDIEVELVILTTAIQSDVEARVIANLTAYKEERKTRLGIDVVRTQIIRACMVEGVYDVDVISPAADIVADVNEYTGATTTSISVTGTHDE